STRKEDPMEHKFQWSVFVDPSRQEQYVVRCDDFGDFLDGIELVKSLLPDGKEPTPLTEQEPEIPVDQCAIHNKSMKQRTSKDGTRKWYDHRWKEGDVWYVCNGKYEKVQG